MARTDRIHDRGLVSWIQYEAPVQQRNGSWRANAEGRIRYQHDDGSTFTIELPVKTVFGRSAEHAESAAKSRVEKGLQRVVAFVLEARDPTK